MSQTAANKGARAREIRDRVVELVRVLASALVPNPANWRRHPEGQRSALRGVLRQIGYADALLARREGDRLVLIDGHLRQSLDPHQVVPVLVLDLDQREAELLLATLDPLAAMATPDPQILAGLLGRVEASSAVVRDLLASLARSAGLPFAPLLEDPDHTPPAPEPRARPGDLWQLGPHRLACADSTDPSALGRLMAGESAEVLWTDPPYGVGYQGKTARALRITGDQAEGLDRLLQASFAAAGEVLAPGPLGTCATRPGPSSLSSSTPSAPRGGHMYVTGGFFGVKGGSVTWSPGSPSTNVSTSESFCYPVCAGMSRDQTTRRWPPVVGINWPLQGRWIGNFGYKRTL
jgi:hypothetical protein